MPNGSGLDVPAWVPPIVASVARKLFADATYMPAFANLVRRLATDRRMQRVWGPLQRRQGGAQRGGSYEFRLANRL